MLAEFWRPAGHGEVRDLQANFHGLRWYISGLECSSSHNEAPVPVHLVRLTCRRTSGVVPAAAAAISASVLHTSSGTNAAVTSWTSGMASWVCRSAASLSRAWTSAHLRPAPNHDVKERLAGPACASPPLRRRT